MHECTIVPHDCVRRRQIGLKERYDDESDASIISPKLAQRASVKGIGKMSAIQPVTLRVALKTGSDLQRFAVSRAWGVIRTVFHLSSGRLAILNIRYLVEVDYSAGENLLIGLPVLRHLKTYLKALLDANREALDDIDCALLDDQTKSNVGCVSRVMSVRQKRQQDNGRDTSTVLPGDSSRMRVNYFMVSSREDPFADPTF